MRKIMLFKKGEEPKVVEVDELSVTAMPPGKKAAREEHWLVCIDVSCDDKITGEIEKVVGMQFEDITDSGIMGRAFRDLTYIKTEKNQHYFAARTLLTERKKAASLS